MTGDYCGAGHAYLIIIIILEWYLNNWQTIHVMCAGNQLKEMDTDVKVVITMFVSNALFKKRIELK